MKWGYGDRITIVILVAIVVVIVVVIFAIVIAPLLQRPPPPNSLPSYSSFSMAGMSELTDRCCVQEVEVGKKSKSKNSCDEATMMEEIGQPSTPL